MEPSSEKKKKTDKEFMKIRQGTEPNIKEFVRETFVKILDVSTWKLPP
jgi:hypothetical protein